MKWGKDLQNRIANQNYTWRLLSIPDSTLQKLKTEAIQILKRDEPTEPIQDSPAHYLSSNDILLAWIARLQAQIERWPPEKPINIGNAFNFRPVILAANRNGRFPCEETKGAYLGSASYSAFTLLPCEQLLSQPLATTARLIRQALQQQRTPQQTEALLTLTQHLRETSGSNFEPLFGSPDMALLIWSNWQQTGLYALDFSAAIQKKTPSSSERVAEVHLQEVDGKRKLFLQQAPGVPFLVDPVTHITGPVSFTLN